MALMPSDNSEPKVLSQWAFPEGSVKRIEQVGSGYERLKKKYAELWERVKKGASAHFESDEETKGEQKNSDEDDEVGVDSKAREEFEKKRKKKTKEQIEKEALEGNLYGILELQDKTYEAGDSDISRAYKKLALRYHPDKLGDKITETDKTMWLKIQEAYETLMDPAKRKKYDSSLPFDERIPEPGSWTADNFFEVFSKAFNHNSLWSKKKPCPNFGDASTPINEVKAFYKFWDNFQSWREFSQYDEYDVNEAQDRYEKRYMEAENRRARKEHVMAERKRLIKLTETAYNADPRIQNELRQIEEEKQRKKQEKWEYKQREKQAGIELERKLAEEKMAAEKAEQERVKAEEEAKKERARVFKAKVKDLIELCQAKLPGTRYDKFWVQTIIKKYNTTEKLSQVYDLMSATDTDDLQSFEAAFNNLNASESEAAERARLEAQLQEEEAKRANEFDGDWTKEEVSLLTKGIVKFPPGTVNRWKMIAEFVGTKTQKEAIKKAQELVERR